MDVLENAVTEKNALVEAEAFPTDDRVTYKDSTYEIVSKVAYLIGVPKRIFDNEHEAPKIEIYEKLDADKTARIIRHLCIIRTAIERNFKHINERMKFSYLSISSMPEYVPQDSLQQLNADGISFIKKSSTKLTFSSLMRPTTLKPERIRISSVSATLIRSSKPTSIVWMSISTPMLPLCRRLKRTDSI